MRFNPDDPLFSDQWHLQNLGQASSTGQRSGRRGEDINVLPVWNQGITGQGIVIGIVDDGLDSTHPDLRPNYRSDLSIDIIDQDADPSPVLNDFDYHGTAVAGLAAGRGGNGIGTTGVAPNASLAAIRLITSQFATDRQEAEALSYRNQDIDIYNNSWGPLDGVGVFKPQQKVLRVLRAGVNNGRGGLGSIFVWAGGNGRLSGDNVNYDGYANSRFTIAVAAVDQFGRQARYSEPGAALLVSAYGSSDFVGITTTDLVSSNGYNQFGEGDYGTNYADLDYTNDFGGTSAAAPIVSGAIALMLEANSQLTWRDVQHILVATARTNDANDADWTVNAAGHEINHKYGFGVVDAAAAVEAALNWTTVAPEIAVTSPRLQPQTEIPNRDSTGLTATFTVERNIRLEWVEVVFDADHAEGDDLEIVLTSPDGTQSVLAEEHSFYSSANQTYENWRFTSARHWDELGAGTWTLQVFDRADDTSGIWNAWRLKLYGTKSVASTPGDDVLIGGRENDAIAGEGGNDRLTGLGSGDRLLGGRGHDTLNGRVGADYLIGGYGNDNLLGENGADQLDGDQGRDYLLGGNGNDVLRGGGENDRLRGAAGRDIFVLEGLSGRDRILDFEIRRDRLGLSGGLQWNDLRFFQQGANTSIHIGSQKLLAVLVDIDASSLQERDFIRV
jgi:subtilisin-like proprotein convertase family protein